MEGSVRLDMEGSDRLDMEGSDRLLILALRPPLPLQYSVTV